jgi:glycosyltransferase involved in cell wall biosynthesis
MAEPLLTLVLPYFNEEAFIGETLASLARQVDRRFRLVLVDNGSTDRSTEVARGALTDLGGLEAEWLSEPTPGKIHALRRGIAVARTPFVGTIDADTFYPPEYTARALALLTRDPATAVALAFTLGEDRAEPVGSFRWLGTRLWPRKCHGGGAGQCYRRDMLEDAGGFAETVWPYVLEDHEIIHRLGRRGRLGYARDHVCYPSERRVDRSACSWNITERLLYKLLPDRAMDWFFYRFLAKRLERRGLKAARLQDRQWGTGAAAQRAAR